MVSPIVHPTAAMLKEIRLFTCFKDNELEEILKMGKMEKKEAHSNVVIEGEPSWGLYLILDGVVGVFKNNKMSGETYEVGFLRAGNFFGEMSLVDENPRSATVTALAEVTLFHIQKKDFQTFLARSTDLKMRFYESCIQDIVYRLRELGDNYVISQYQLWKTAIKKEKEKEAA